MSDNKCWNYFNWLIFTVYRQANKKIQFCGFIIIVCIIVFCQNSWRLNSHQLFKRPLFAFYDLHFCTSILYWTTVGGISRVILHMISQGTLPVEWYGTFWTPVRFFSSVNPHMPGKVPCCYESFITLCTSVRFLSSVNFHMGFHVASNAEWLATFWTPVRFFSCVNCPMISQAKWMLKWFGTFWTTERFLSRMNFGMGS